MICFCLKRSLWMSRAWECLVGDEQRNVELALLCHLWMLTFLRSLVVFLYHEDTL